MEFDSQASPSKLASLPLSPLSLSLSLSLIECALFKRVRSSGQSVSSYSPKEGWRRLEYLEREGERERERERGFFC